MAVNQRNADAIREAMTKLLDRADREGLECLTWNNVCSVSGVPRATAARAHDIIDDWKRKVSEKKAEFAARALEPEGDAHDRQKRDGETIRRLRETIRIMANQIQALTLALECANVTESDIPGNVVSMKARAGGHP